MELYLSVILLFFGLFLSSINGIFLLYNTVKIGYNKPVYNQLPVRMNKLFSPKSMHNTLNYPSYNELLVITNTFCCPKLLVITKVHCTVKFEYDGQPWDLTKVAVVQKWLLYRGWSLKIAL